MAQQNPQVPKFGDWENEESVPYTAYFDKARKIRTSGGKMMNPNVPEENPDLSFKPNQLPASKPRSEPEERVVGQGTGRQDGDFKESPARHENNKRYGSRGGSSNEANSNNKRPGRLSGGSENNSSYEKSPLHHQVKASGRSVGDPLLLWEGNKGSYDGTGRSRPRTNLRGHESPDKDAALPKFGDWDENDPAAAESYTHVFDKVREARNYPGRGLGTQRTPSHTPARNPPPADSAKFCCFSWGGR